jgi:carboxyl-terminal processing protease
MVFILTKLNETPETTYTTPSQITTEVDTYIENIPPEQIQTEDTLPKIVTEELSSLWQQLEQNSVYKLNESLAINSMKEALVASLNDPYSNWLSTEDYQLLTQSINSEYSGIGVDLTLVNEDFVIANVLKNSNAYTAGLKIGDVILTINQVNLHGNYDLLTAAKSLNKKAIELTYKRGQETFTITFDLLDYHEPSVVHYAINKDIYYIDINTFSEETFTIFEEAIREVMDGGYTSVIYDLRFNFGGWMQICYDMLSLVNDEEEIAFIQDSSAITPALRTKEQLFDTTAYVLINNESYSAAELFAQGMKIHDQALIVGETSFGKGVMQSLIESEDGVLKLSVAHFSASNHDFFTKIGIIPDNTIKQNYDKGVDFQLQALIDLIQNIDN